MIFWLHIWVEIIQLWHDNFDTFETFETGRDSYFVKLRNTKMIVFCRALICTTLILTRICLVIYMIFILGIQMCYQLFFINHKSGFYVLQWTMSIQAIIVSNPIDPNRYPLLIPIKECVLFNPFWITQFSLDCSIQF